MTQLNAKTREKLQPSQFAYVDQEGGEHLPIHDASHVRNAMARFGQTKFESKAARETARLKILRAAIRHKVSISEAAHGTKSKTS